MEKQPKEERAVTVSPLTDEISKALQEKEQEAKVLLKLSGDEAPELVVENIKNFVKTLLLQGHSQEDLKEYALQFGALWGKMVIKEYSWTWKHLDFGDGIQGIYVVSPNSFYCCPPLFFLNKILMGQNKGLDGNNDNTVLLLFNMMNNIEKQEPPRKFQTIS